MRGVRTHSFRSFGGSLLGLLLASPVLADDSQSGLPQFDTAYFPSQIFWLFLVFGVLYVLMARIALPRVEATQVARRVAIEGDLKAASAANTQAKVVVADYNKSLTDARSQAQSIITEMSQAMAHEASERRLELQTELTKKLHDTELKIRSRTEETLHSLEKSVHELSQAIVDQVIRAKS